MTNEQMILENRIFLMNEGLIGHSAETMVYNGEEIFEPEEIHTFAYWKKKGYIVKKGEKAIAKFPIWRRSAGKKKEEEDKKEEEEKKETRNMYKTVAYFFSENQVKKMEDKKE